MFSIKSYSQEIYQQTALELKDVLDNDKSYLCKATTSIELLPGFVYCPCSNKEMSLSIDRYSIFCHVTEFYIEFKSSKIL